MAIMGLPEERIRQKPSPLPPLPEHDALSAEQWSILLAIADAVVPSCIPFKGDRLLQHPLRQDIYEASSKRLEQVADFEGGREVVSTFLGESASSFQAFRTGISRTININLPEQARKELLFILSALNTRAGSLALTGYVSPLNTLPVQAREQILQSWATSRIPLYRTLYKSLTSLVKLQWVRNSPSLGRLLSYPKTPVHDNPPGTFFPFTFVQIPPSATDEAQTIETDVVIIGSGCGGAVAAKMLAEAGLRVIVTDKSYYWPPEHLPMSETEGTSHMFVEGAALQSDDGSIAILGGSAWGGGGTINWSASLQTQGMVRREWAQKFGLAHFTSSAFQADLDAVCERMGAGIASIEHNKGNRTLLDGARKLGWNVAPVPQNTGGEAHNCGYCTLGCGSCGKKGPTETFLPDAAKAGATFLEGFDAREVLFANSKDNDRVATGVRGVWTGRDSNGGVAGRDRTKRNVVIKASRVIVSAGTLASPLVLLRSGLKNPHIGRHLHLHPVTFTTAIWDEDIRPWEGPILTAVVKEFENMDGDGYGPKLECTTMLPGLFLPLLPWHGGMQYKELCARMKKMTGYIALTRDRYGGRVYPDPVDGRVRVAYNPSKYDRKHILEGVIRLAEIMYVEGAREISTPGCPRLEPFVRPRSDEGALGSPLEPSVNNADFQAWLQRLRTMGLPSPDASFASAHQMGTCRMGTSPNNSVIDPKGQVWGTKGLYVADASALPSASGVNPMVTTMAIARGVARNVIQDVLGHVADPTRARL